MRKIKVSSLYLEAWKNSNEMNNPDEVKNVNMTGKFFYELEKMIESGELINININGQVRKGKSTLAIQLGRHIMGVINKAGLNPTKFGIGNIARDQQELSKKMRNPKLFNTVMVVDEYNELELTGENSTIEQTLLNQYSDVQAGS